VRLPDGEEIMTQYRRVTDRQTDGRTRANIASCG